MAASLTDGQNDYSFGAAPVASAPTASTTPVAPIPPAPVAPLVTANTTPKPQQITLGNGQVVNVDQAGNFTDASGKPISNSTVATSTAAPVAPTTPVVPPAGSSTPAATPTPTGVTTPSPGSFIQGVAPAGSTQSSNGNWVDSNGNQYSMGPGTSTTNSSVDLTSADAVNKKILADQAQAVEDARAFNLQQQNIQNGVIPLTVSQQAQIDGLTQQYNQLISQQQLVNTGATGAAAVRGYQSGAAEYDASFDQKVIGSIAAAGASKVADLQSKLTTSIAQLTQAFKDSNIAIAKSAYDTLKSAQDAYDKGLSDYVTKTQTAIKAASDAQIAAQKTYYDQVTKPIQDMASDVLKNTGDAKLAAAVAASPDVNSAIATAGNALQTSSDATTNRYLMYARQADASGKPKMSYDEWYAKDQRLQANQKYAEAYATEAGKNAADNVGAVSAGSASTSAVDGSDITNTIANIAKSNKLSATTQAAISPILGVINAATTMAELNPSGTFSGISPLNSILNVKFPFTDIGLPGRNALQSKAGVQNSGYINGINLKVQQWASGASLTKTQTEQVEKMVPTVDDTDAKVQEKLNNLVNFMQQQVKSALATSGVVYDPVQVDLFDGTKGLEDIFSGVSGSTPVM